MILLDCKTIIGSCSSQLSSSLPLCVSSSGLDPSQRQGVEELISAAPCRFDHAALFSILQKHTLQHRMNDSFSCLVCSHKHIIWHTLCSYSELIDSLLHWPEISWESDCVKTRLVYEFTCFHISKPVKKLTLNSRHLGYVVDRAGPTTYFQRCVNGSWGGRAAWFTHKKIKRSSLVERSSWRIF